jgi:uncharacterized RDD family membrane protein YckC
MTRTNVLQIVTPEGIRFSLNLAGPITRFLAWVIDLACIWIIVMTLNTVLGFLGALNVDLAGGLMILAYFLIQIGYGIFLEWFWRGQTIGKRLLGLRVMDEQGLSLQFNQVVIRNLLRAVDVLPGLYLVGGISCVVSRRAQRLGDFAARTIVVRTISMVEPDLQQIFSDKFNSLREYPHLAARLRQRVSPREADVALQALLRRNNFAPVDRLELFAEIASHFQTIVKFPQEAVDGVTDEQYVRNVVDVLFRG